MKTVLTKLSSRKLWLAIAGIVSGLAIALGVEASAIETIAGAVISVVSAVSYIIVEGKIDAERVKNAIESVQEVVEIIKEEESAQVTGSGGENDGTH